MPGCVIYPNHRNQLFIICDRLPGEEITTIQKILKHLLPYIAADNRTKEFIEIGHGMNLL
jgi:hypothetical protein